MSLKFSKSKKSTIEIGFTWIFILIAGAVILGIFTYITLKQGSSWSNILGGKMLNDLSVIFVGAQVSRNTASLIEIPKTKLEFTCNNYAIRGMTRSFDNRIVFAPKEFTSAKIITWSRGWSLGFRITNFLYITTPYIKYYIVYPQNNPYYENLAIKIEKDLPTQITKEKIVFETGKIKNENYDKVIVMLLGINYTDLSQPSYFYNPDEFKKYKKDDVIFIFVNDIFYYLSDADEGFFCSLVFKNKNLELITQYDEIHDVKGQKFSMLDMSSLYGAFISGNLEMWYCMQRKAYKKSQTAIQLYHDRLNYFNLTDPSCYIYYETKAKPFLLGMKKLVSQDKINMSNLIDSIRSLNQINELLERASCPMIY